MRTFTFFLFLFFSLVSFAQGELIDFEDGFRENTFISIDSSVWEIDTPQGVLFDSAYSPPRALITNTAGSYASNADASVTISVNTDDLVIGVHAFQWVQKIDIDTGDLAVIELYDPFNERWVNAFNTAYSHNFYGFDSLHIDSTTYGIYGLRGQDTAWQNVWFCISNLEDVFFNNPGIDSVSGLIRYRLLSDSVDQGGEGWMIDNIMVNLTYVHTIADPGKIDYLQITPNPTAAQLDLLWNQLEGKEYSWRIVDALGRRVEKGTTTETSLDVSAWPNGYYQLQLFKEGTAIHKEPFVVRH